jgi:hypothetical protein
VTKERWGGVLLTVPALRSGSGKRPATWHFLEKEDMYNVKGSAEL